MKVKKEIRIIIKLFFRKYMESNYVIGFIFIVLVLIAILILRHGDLSSVAIVLSLAGAIFLGYLFRINDYFIPEPIDADDRELSKYGNISVSTDVDLMRQTPPEDITASAPSPDTNEIDNTDVVESVLSRGTTMTPVGGYTPTQVDNTQLIKKYLDPLSGQQDADEMLARKQAQRSQLNKRAIDGQVRDTKNDYLRNFQEELNENEKRVWYSSEAQPMETDWTPY